VSAASGMASPVTPEILYHSANASACFCCSCLEPTASGFLRARSSFVDPAGRAVHWHDFGDLEGPGWAANAVGGAHLLYRWGAMPAVVGLSLPAHGFAALRWPADAAAVRPL
jgi:hypothetical protein